MRDTEMLARAILEAGGKGIDDARAEIQRLEAGLDALGAAYQQGKLKITEYASESARLRVQIDQLRAGVAGAEAAIARYGSSQAAAAAMAKQADAASRAHGQGIVSAAFAAPELLAADGEPVQGPASLATQGFAALWPYLANVARELGLVATAAGSSAKGIDGLQRPIEELEDKPARPAADVHEPGEGRTHHERVGSVRTSLNAAEDAADRPGEAITGQWGEAEHRTGALVERTFRGNDPTARVEPARRMRQAGRGDLAGPIAGSTPEEVKERGERQTPNGFKADGPKNTRDAKEQGRDRERARLADAMAGGAVGREILGRGDLSDADVQVRVNEALRRAGMGTAEIGELLMGVAKALRERTDAAVRDRALEPAIGEGASREPLSQEVEGRAGTPARPERIGKTAGEFVSGADEIFRRLQLAATADDVRKGQGAEVAEKQLTEARLTNAKLDGLTRAVEESRGGAVIARFGPRR